MAPRVTIIIPTYNWSSVLPFSIGSALDQTFRDFELLVVGDGCTDESAEVVGRFTDPRVRWINLPACTGHQSGPNNEALRQARGEIVAYLGHDDLWLPHHLAVVVAAIDEGADIAHGVVAMIDPGGSVRPVFLEPALYGNWMPPTGFAHRHTVTERVGGWRHYREVRVDPESDLLQRAREAGFRFASVDRLTAIKFSAGVRPDVYKTRPFHEQNEWLGRMRTEPDIEAVLLARCARNPRSSSSRMTLRSLVRELLGESVLRLRRSLHPRRLRLLFSRPGARIDATKRFKGL